MLDLLKSMLMMMMMVMMLVMMIVINQSFNSISRSFFKPRCVIIVAKVITFYSNQYQLINFDSTFLLKSMLMMVMTMMMAMMMVMMMVM